MFFIHDLGWMYMKLTNDKDVKRMTEHAQKNIPPETKIPESITRRTPQPYTMTDADAAVGRRPEYTGILLPRGDTHPALVIDQIVAMSTHMLLVGFVQNRTQVSGVDQILCHSEGARSLHSALVTYGFNLNPRDILLSNMLLVCDRREQMIKENKIPNTPVDMGIFFAALASTLTQYRVHPKETWEAFIVWVKKDFDFDVVGVPVV